VTYGLWTLTAASVSFVRLFLDSMLIFTVMLRQKRAILALVVDRRTLKHTFDIATSLMWKLFTPSPQVCTLFKQLLNSFVFGYVQTQLLYQIDHTDRHPFNGFFQDNSG